MKRQLSPKQQLFIKEYQIDFNASASAQRSGYSTKNADKIGHELLGKTRVSEQIKVEIDRRARELEITSSRILSELAKIAFFNIADLLETGDDNSLRLRSFDKMDSFSTTAIKNISQGKLGLNIQLHDKISALKMLGDYLNLWSGEPTKEQDSKEAKKLLLERVLEIVRKRSIPTKN